MKIAVKTDPRGNFLAEGGGRDAISGTAAARSSRPARMTMVAGSLLGIVIAGFAMPILAEAGDGRFAALEQKKEQAAPGP